MANLFFTLVFLFYMISFVNAIKNGITMELVLRNSPLSPLSSNPNATQFERFQNLFVAHNEYLPLRPLNPPIVSGEFLTKISIGTPPVDKLVLVDTGSDLLWMACSPCKGECPVNKFDPLKSTSYKGLSCQSNHCDSLYGQYKLHCEQNICKYNASYIDGSYSEGDLAQDILTLRSSSGESMPSLVAFGCGYQMSKMTDIAGIMGLGLGSLSIVNQLPKSFRGMFSYCFAQIDDESNPPSKLSIGSNALVSGPKVVSTPLTKKSDDSSYYLHLKGVTVGSKTLNFDTFVNENQAGNIIIDSGSMLTYFMPQFYKELELEIVKHIQWESKRVKGYLCYNNSNVYSQIPKVIFHFIDADLELPSTSIFVKTNSAFCFTMASSDDNDTNIFGNLNQMNYLVGYDLVKKKVSFKQIDCSTFS